MSAERIRGYLAGPMSGFPDDNYPLFHATAARLRALNFDIINPAELNPEHGLPWEDYLRRDIPELCKCHAIFVLPGWEDSRGARLELHIAIQLKMDVIFL